MVILTYKLQESIDLAKFISDDGFRLTHSKMDQLQDFIVDIAISGGLHGMQLAKQHVPSYLHATKIARIMHFSGEFSISRCGVQVKPFHNSAFMEAQSTFGKENACPTTG